MAHIKLTYSDWKALGYQVQYGERSPCKNENGDCLFVGIQVRKIN